jgi:hypothetical protein
MMTIKMITEVLDTAAADMTYSDYDDEIRVTIEDFIGFDEDWDEVYRDFEDKAAVEAVLDWLEEHADRVEEDLYGYYHFGDITVVVGYSSFDI